MAKKIKTADNDDRYLIFEEYFDIVTKIVYTLTSINEHNEALKRINMNIENQFDFDDDMNDNVSEASSKTDRLTSILNLHESLKSCMESIKQYKKYNFNLERLIADLKLSQIECYILYSLTVYSLYTDPLASLSMRKLLELVSTETAIYIRNHKYIAPDSPLIKSNILTTSRDNFSSSIGFEIGQTLVSFSNSKLLFALLEEADYSLIEEILNEKQVDDFATANVLIKNSSESPIKDISPKEIVAELDKAVVGQKRAKRVLAVQSYLHYMRVQNKSNIPFRSNIMLIGPTGVGKTYLAKTLAGILNLPFARSDVTTLTETGYVGDDVETVLYELYKKSGGNIAHAEKGIVFLDEIDKIAKADAHQSTTGNPGDKAVQEALLSMLNGEELRIPEYGDRRMMHSSDGILLNTKNILFIFGGAFVGIEDIIKARLKGQHSMGFAANLVGSNTSKENILEKVDIKDLEKFGMIPEFLGRVPIVTTLRSLSKEEMKEVLTKSADSPVLRYHEFFDSMDKKFSITDEAIDAVVAKAFDLNMGARSLKSIVENIMINVLYNFDGLKHGSVKINAKDVENYNINSEKEFDDIGKKGKAHKSSSNEVPPFLA